MRITARLPLTLAFAALLLASCDSPSGPDGPGVPAQLDVVSGNDQQGTVGEELAQPLVVRVTDDKDKPVEGQVVNFRVVSGGGSVFAGTAVTNAQGEARERWRLGTSTADSQRVEARAVDAATGQSLVFGTFRATAAAGVPAAIVPVGPAARSGTTGAALADSLAAQVRDQYGNPVPQAAVVWTVRAGGGGISPQTGTTDAQGIARAMWTLGTRVDSVQVADAAAGVALRTEFTATAAVTMGATLVVRSGGGQTGTVGTALPQPVRVALLLPTGVPVVGATVTWTPVAGSVSPQSSLTDGNGEAAATWTLGTAAGLQGLIATTPGANALTVNAMATPGPVSQLLRVSGDGQSAAPGAVLTHPLVVMVADQHGNTVAGAPVAFAVTSGGGSVNPVTGTTDAAGRFSTTWTLGGASGAQTVRASSGSLPPVSFTATALSSISIAIVVPRPNVVVADSFFLIARGSSTQVVSATATIEGGATLPLRLTGGPEFSGWIMMPAGAPGPREVVVRASAANGDSAFARMNVILDRPPRITVTAPVEGYVARPELRVDADCTDDDPAGCSRIQLSTPSGGVVASGTGGLHTTVSLAGAEGRKVRLFVQGTDSRGQTVQHAVDVFVESSPRLTEIATAPAGRLWDYDAGRLLYVAPGTPWVSNPNDFGIRIRERASGSETTLRQGRGDLMSWRNHRGYLHPDGAIFNADGVFDWRGGTLERLEDGGVVQSTGDWAVWGSLYRRNLVAGTTVDIADEAGGKDVAANGDVVFGKYLYDREVFRYRGGIEQQLTDSPPEVQNSNPVTDGINVVYTRQTRGPVGEDLYSVQMITPTGSFELSGARRGVQPYAVNNGWAAFTLIDAAAKQQVWIRAPDGTTYQATHSATGAGIASLGPNGELVFNSGGRRYVLQAPHTGTAVEVGAAWDEMEGRLEWRNGDLIAFLGRSAFRVDY